MSKHYIIRLRDTELWVSSNMEFGSYGGTKYHPHLVKDPIRCARYDTYEKAEKFAEKHIPEGHWVVHRLIPKTELTEKPASETFVVGGEEVKEEDLVAQVVPVKIVEVDRGVLATIRGWLS